MSLVSLKSQPLWYLYLFIGTSKLHHHQAEGQQEPSRSIVYAFLIKTSVRHRLRYIDTSQAVYLGSSDQSCSGNMDTSKKSLRLVLLCDIQRRCTAVMLGTLLLISLKANIWEKIGYNSFEERWEEVKDIHTLLVRYHVASIQSTLRLIDNWQFSVYHSKWGDCCYCLFNGSRFVTQMLYVLVAATAKLVLVVIYSSL